MPLLAEILLEGCRLSSVASQKTCPYCREAIHDEARKCPHCNQWLGKAMAMVYAPLIILFGIAAYFLIWPLSLFGGGADPAALLSEIVVVDSSFRFNTQGDYTYVSAVGTIRNDSEDIAADDVYIEVQYFDGEGTLIDTRRCRAVRVDVVAWFRGSVSSASACQQPRVRVRHPQGVRALRTRGARPLLGWQRSAIRSGLASGEAGLAVGWSS